MTTNLPILTRISSPIFPDPLPTYSKTINLAHSAVVVCISGTKYRAGCPLAELVYPSTSLLWAQCLKQGSWGIFS